MEIRFPIGGLHTGAPYEQQPPGTTPACRNVRPSDVDEGRARGGQRPGLVKAFSTQVEGSYPIIAMVQIATTYIEPG
jgi:hypothetical protein